MSRSLSRAARTLAVAALAAAWGLCLLAAPATAAAPSPGPSGSPSASGSPTDGERELATFGLSAASDGVPDSRSYLSVTAAPGSVIYDSVAVLNQSNQPLELDVYAADAVNAADGSVGLPDRSSKPTDAGAWITVGASTVNVPGQSAAGTGLVTVPITITIPLDAEPGDHLAGVVASLTARGTADGDGQAATVNLEQRVGLRVYVQVAGDTAPGLAVEVLSATYHQSRALGLAGAGSATVRYTLTNTGNTRLDVLASTTVSGLFGLLEEHVTADPISELLPKASVTQTVEVPGVWPAVLDHVTVSATVDAPTAGEDPGLGAISSTVALWAVPWGYLTVLLVAVVAWWLLRRRAARRPAPGRHSPHGGTPPAANGGGGTAGPVGPDPAAPPSGDRRHEPASTTSYR